MLKLLNDGWTTLLTPPSPASHAMTDFLSVVVPALILLYVIRFWKAALKAAVLIAIVILPFTPMWDGFWTLVTKDWLRKHSGVTTVLRGEPQPVAHRISDANPD